MKIQIALLLALTFVAGNARAVRQHHAEFIQYLDVDDPLAGAEMNTPQEYAALATLINEQAR